MSEVMAWAAIAISLLAITITWIRRNHNVY